MRYYLIAGEASGDLHASVLMRALREGDPQAEFRFVGGEMMLCEAPDGQAADYRALSYMGIIPVLRHLGTILSHMRRCREDILSWHPDALVLVDYPGFNLRMASFVHHRTRIPVFYYISPKIWAWKEWRIGQIKSHVDAMLCILPFEKEFYEKKHGYPVTYVGNPTKEEVDRYLRSGRLDEARFLEEIGGGGKTRVALLAGSRRQEIRSNLPVMLRVAERHPGTQFLLAGAPGIDAAFYEGFLKEAKKADVRLVFSRTYDLLSLSRAALVTSGTATLETALLGVPQAVCYHMSMGRLMRLLERLVLSVRFISLVNLIAGREVVRELIGDRMNPEELDRELERLIGDEAYRQRMLDGYRDVRRRLGDESAPARAAQTILERLAQRIPVK